MRAITYLILFVTETKLFSAYYIVEFCNYSKYGIDINKNYTCTVLYCIVSTLYHTVRPQPRSWNILAGRQCALCSN